MRRMLTMVMVMAAMTLAVAAGPEDGVKEAGAGWRQGAIKQDKALLEKYLADDLVYTHGGGQTETKARVHRQRHEGAVTLPGDGAERHESACLRQDGGALGPRGRHARERREVSHAHARGVHAERERIVADVAKGICACAYEINSTEIGRLQDWKIVGRLKIVDG